MDELLRVLGHPLRLQIVERLLLGKPKTQEELRIELEASKKAMSDNLGHLIEARLVVRDRARGPCFVPHAERLGELLQLTADLDSVIADDELDKKAAEAKQKRDRARALRKARMATGAVAKINKAAS